MAICERNLETIEQRILAVELDQIRWMDEEDYLKTVKSNLLEHPTQDAEWEDLVRQSNDELQECQQNVAADEEILETLRTTLKIWSDKKEGQNNILVRKRQNFQRRQARWQARLDGFLKDAERIKRELTQVAAKIQSTTWGYTRDIAR